MNRIVVGPEGSFLRATTLWSICRRKSGAHRDAKAFTILKNEPYLQSYELLASSFSPRPSSNWGFSKAAALCSSTSYSNHGDVLRRHKPKACGGQRASGVRSKSTFLYLAGCTGGGSRLLCL